MSKSVKKFILLLFLFTSSYSIFAQDSTNQIRKSTSKRDEKRQRNNAISKQQEEGVLSYNKQNAFGVQLRTNGYGFFFEKGKMRSPRFTNTYSAEITEIKHPKEAKSGNTEGIFANTFIYGKINNFYQLKLGYGQQYIFGQKGNKNGIAVMGLVQGGLALGFLKPYILRIDNQNTEEEIKYSDDNDAFLDRSIIIGSAGMFKGWDEVKLKPGAYVKTALRFDFGQHNESISAVEIGFSLDYYAQKIPILAIIDNKQQVFYQGHIAFVFGNRK